MVRLPVVIAIFVVCSASVANGQAALAYDFSLRDSTPLRVNASVGHTIISGTSMRMDMSGRSGFSSIGGADLGDSTSLVTVDTGVAQTLTVLGHRTKKYVQFQPVLYLRAVSERMANGPGVSQMDFSGSSVTVDSLGPADDIAGYKTIHFRINVVVRFSIPQTPLGEQTVIADYFVAPSLAEFSHTGVVLDRLDGSIAFIPGVPASFREKIHAAENRVRSGLPLKVILDLHGSLFGTGVSNLLTIEAANVRRVTAEPALFAVPADYERVTPRGMPPPA